MALIVADRVKETTDTADGTSAYNLLGAETGFQTFSSTVGDGNTTYYACTDGTDFEIGIGTYASSTDTLARTTILQSSNSDSAVVWGAGTKDIFVTLPADKAIFEDASNNVAIGNNITVGGTVDGVDIATRDGVLTTTTTTANAAMPKTGGTFTGDVVFEGSTVDITFQESQDAIKFDDGARAYFGSSSDLTIYHEGIISNETRLWNVTGDVSILNYANGSDISIGTDDGSGGTTNYFVADGSTGEVQLYHYGSPKLATQSGGIDVTGNITVSGTVDGVDIASRDGVLTTTTTTADAAMPKAGGTFTGDIAFEGATANDFETTVTVTDPTADRTITLPDSDGTVVLLDSSGDLTFETGDANKTIVFDTSNRALQFKRPTGSDAYGKSPELTFGTFGHAKIFDEDTIGASNSGLNIVDLAKIHIDTPAITYRDGDASGEENLEVTMSRSTITLRQPENNPATPPSFTRYNHELFTEALGYYTVTLDYGSNTLFDEFGLSFILDKQQNTVANDDNIALFIFQGKNSAGGDHGYAKITGTMQDVTDAAEDGILLFSVSSGGSYVDYFQIDGDGNHTLFFKPIAFEGSTADAFETTLDVIDPTQDNTLNLPNESGTIATRAHAVALASVLG